MMGALSRSLLHLRRSRGWSVAVIAVLALGIGTALAGFVLVDAVLLRPLGIHDQARVVRVGATGEDRAWLNSTPWLAYESYRALGSVFAGVAAEGWPGALHWQRRDGTTERLEGRGVSGNYFEVLGVPAVLGRPLLARDDRAGADPVAVVSHRFWRTRLGARADVVGASLRINGIVHTVVGVLGPGFRGMDLTPLDVWLPARATMGPADIWTSPNWNGFDVFARLQAGASLAQASAAVDAVAKATRGWGGGNAHAMAVPVSRLGNTYRDGEAVRGASLLAAGVLTVLLLTCVNAAGLLLVRAERRRGELALRASLGATRWRLAGQLGGEALVLLSVAVVLGLVLALGLSHAVLALAGAPGVLGLQDIPLPSVERAVVGLAVVFGLALAICVAPLFRIVGTDGAIGVRPGLHTARTGRRWRAGRLLVMSQFALSVLVVGAAFTFVGAFAALWMAPVGVGNADALVVRLDYGVGRGDYAAMQSRNEQILALLGAEPAVAAGAIAAMVPISGASIEVAPQLPESGDRTVARGFYNPVSDGYFDTLGIPLLSGRGFMPQDANGPAVVVVSRAAAERLWPGADPLGRTIQLMEGPPATVVGVAADVRYQALDEPWRNVYYVPLAQMEFGGFFHAVALPRPGATGAAHSALRAAAGAVEPDRAQGAVEAVAQRIDRAVAGPRFVAGLTTGFGALSLLLAAIGIYGAFAFLVSVRRRELGVRLAVGAAPRALFSMLLGEAGGLIALGVGLGVLGGAAAFRVFGSVFPELPPTPPLLLLAAVATVALAGMGAVMRPAAAAAAADPATSLRSE